MTIVSISPFSRFQPLHLWPPFRIGRRQCGHPVYLPEPFSRVFKRFPANAAAPEK